MTVVNERSLRDYPADLLSKLLDKKHIFLWGEINEHLSLMLVASVAWMKQSGDTEGDVIQMIINSPGGSIFDGLAAYDAIRLMGLEYEANVVGIAASMAGFLTIMADHRRMTTNSKLMLHTVSGGARGSVEAIGVNFRELEWAQRRIAELMAKRCGGKWTTDRFLNEVMTGADKWYTAQEALELGLIDEVAGVDAKPSAKSTTKKPTQAKKEESDYSQF